MTRENVNAYFDFIFFADYGPFHGWRRNLSVSISIIIAKYGSDGKKIWEIHTTDHENLGPHYHPWENGHPRKITNSKGEEKNEAHSLDGYKQSLLDKVRNYGKMRQ